MESFSAACETRCAVPMNGDTFFFNHKSFSTPDRTRKRSEEEMIDGHRYLQFVVGLSRPDRRIVCKGFRKWSPRNEKKAGCHAGSCSETEMVS